MAQKKDELVKQISVDMIAEPENPARMETLEVGIKELTDSIKLVGILEPLIVKKKGKGFELVAGHRRLMAAKRAGLVVVPCIVRGIQGKEVEQIMFHENVYREDMNDYEEAVFLERVIKDRKINQTEAAELIGKTPGYVSQKLQVLKYPEMLQNAMRSGSISFTSCRKLMEIKDESVRDYYIDTAINSGASINVIDSWVRSANQTPPAEPHAGPGESGQPQPPAPGVYKPQCWICGEAHDTTEMIVVQIDKECATRIKEAVRLADENQGDG